MFASKQVDRPPRFLFFSFARRGCKSWLQMAKSRLLPCCVYAAHWHCQWQKIKWVLAFKQVDHPAHCPAQVSLSAFLPPPPVLIKPRKGSTSLPTQRQPPPDISLSLLKVQLTHPPPSPPLVFACRDHLVDKGGFVSQSKQARSDHPEATCSHHRRFWWSCYNFGYIPTKQSLADL